MPTYRMASGDILHYSEEDAHLVKKYQWWAHNKGRTKYAITEIYPNGKKKGRRVRLKFHRLVLDAPAGKHIDHKNGNGLDNRRENLRLCTSQENSWNSRKTSAPTLSVYKGVTFSGGYWRCYTTTAEGNRRSQTRGRYLSEIDAAHARDNWVREHHGDFAWLNFPAEQETPSMAPMKKRGAKPKLIGGERSKTAPYLGVYREKTSRRWFAKTMFEREVVLLGHYDTPEDAARAYDAWVRENRKPGWRTNFPEPRL